MTRPNRCHPNWSRAELTALRKLWGTMPAADLAARIGRTEDACSAKAWALRLGPGWRVKALVPSWLRPVEPSLAAFIQRHWRSGVTLIAERRGITIGEVMFAAACMGLVGLGRQARC